MVAGPAAVTQAAAVNWYNYFFKYCLVHEITKTNKKIASPFLDF
jgi:hypothetical protein